MIDLLFRIAYRCAYRGMRVYWAVRRPQTHGALVAIWHDNQILLVRNSYVPYYSLPGGYVRRHETSRQAVLRELFEETGVRADPAQLRLALDEHHQWEGKNEHIEIFELEVAEAPKVAVDNREVVGAAFFSPEKALGLELFGPLRRIIEQKVGGGSAAAEVVPTSRDMW